MGDEKCRIHLDVMRKIYMMAVLNLKTARHKCPPQLEILTRQVSNGRHYFNQNHTPKDAFDLKYKSSFRICKKISDKLLMYKTVLERSGECHYNIYNYYILQNIC